MEEKLLIGNKAMDEAMKQEQELLKTKAALEEKRREQVRIEQEAEKMKEEKIELQKNFSSK